MPLSPGTRLGPYQFVAHRRSGGMGEAYEGRDTRLNRTVALKVLPLQVASDATLRQRLEREALAISALNHPHICTLHDPRVATDVGMFEVTYAGGPARCRHLETA